MNMRNKFSWIGYTIMLFSICCCTESSSITSTELDMNEVSLDTFNLTEENINDDGLYFVSDTLTVNRLIPRNVWAVLHPVGSGQIAKILEHGDLFIESNDTNLKIKRVSNKEFKVYINDQYEGYIPTGGPVAGQECLTITSKVRPNKGYVITKYSYNKPVSHPNFIELLTHYETIERKK